MIKKSVEQLKLANESYLEHLKIAFVVGTKMIIGGSKALIHGIIPGFFVKSASDMIKKLYETLLKK